MPSYNDQQNQPLDSDEALLLETFGLQLLAYLCATDQENVRLRLVAPQNQLPAPAEDVLTQALVPLARQVAANVAAQPGLPRRLSLEILGRVADGANISLGVQLHQAAGGDSTAGVDLNPNNGDRVKSALIRMLIDSYPVFLVPPEEYFNQSIVSLFQHPLRDELQEALRADEALSHLFTEDDPGLGRQGFIYTSLGSGFNIQTVSFAEMILQSAWRSVTMKDETPDSGAFIRQALQNIDRLRATTRGKSSTRVPVLVTFTGFKTAGMQQLATPWGNLRPITDRERALAPLDRGSSSRFVSDGAGVSVDYGGEMVLETEIPYLINIARPSEAMQTNEADWPVLQDSETIRRRVEGVQLAALMATERPVGSWATAKLSWIWVDDPYSNGPNISWSSTVAQPAFMPIELTDVECSAMEDWARRVNDKWSAKLSISISRILSAANARTDPADRLVDAVIVWENLFGTSQGGEVTLRITSALAWLLETDSSAARIDLQMRLKRIYASRSSIVHGNKEIASETLAEQSNNALISARDALRKLFLDRPELLDIADAAVRSQRLIMGG